MSITICLPPSVDASHQCVSLGSGNVSGLWFNTYCNRKLGTVCEKMRIGHTSPAPVSRLPVTASCDSGLIETDQYCYQVYPNIHVRTFKCVQIMLYNCRLDRYAHI